MAEKPASRQIPAVEIAYCLKIAIMGKDIYTFDSPSTYFLPIGEREREGSTYVR
jgi:hypothetical protein